MKELPVHGCLHGNGRPDGRVGVCLCATSGVRQGKLAEWTVGVLQDFPVAVDAYPVPNTPADFCLSVRSAANLVHALQPAVAAKVRVVAGLIRPRFSLCYDAPGDFDGL